MQLAIDFESRISAPYARHSSTSRAASQAIEPRIHTQRYEVMQCIKQCGSRGATDAEISALLSLSGDTVRPRRGSLAAAGLIEKSGTRKTASGRDADVWVAV
jgi:hypothetical protein